jgi:ribonuclease HII
VFAAAVILNEKKPIKGLDDSKKLTDKKRDLLRIEIEKRL